MKQREKTMCASSLSLHRLARRHLFNMHARWWQPLSLWLSALALATLSAATQGLQGIFVCLSITVIT
jgi:hypothetical protein